MDEKTRKISVLILLLVIGTILVYSGFTLIVHNFFAKGLLSLFSGITSDRALKIAESLGYLAEVVIVTVMLFTSYSALISPWLFRIAYDLILGYNSNVNVFIVNQNLNLVMGGLCIVLGIYAIFHEYHKIGKHVEEKKIKVKDTLSRFI